MVRIQITDDSQAKLNVVRHLEPLEFHWLDGFSLDGTANAVLLTGSGICDAVGVFPIMGQCVSMDDCVDGYMDYSCDCISGFQMEAVNGEKVCGTIDDCGPNACEKWPPCPKGERLHV